MKRLRPNNINTPDLSAEIFQNRWGSKPHSEDLPRFETLASRFRGGRLLDSACFNSPMPGILKERFPDAEIWALDYSTEVVKAMKREFPDVNYVVGDVMNLPFKDGWFDHVIAGEVIEHMEDPAEFVREQFRVLKRGGTLVLSTPFEEGTYLSAVSEEHLWGFTVSDIKALLEPHARVEIDTIMSSFKIIVAYAVKN